MSSLFGGGGSSPQVNFQPKGFFNQYGFNVSPSGVVGQSPSLTSNISGLQSTFGNQATAFGNLASTVQPGFSQFRQAGLSDIANQFMAQRSNLKDTLAQRRVLGSSFANSQFSQLAATEAQNKADFEASSYIEELNAQYQLIQSQYAAQAQSYSTAISQSNIESATAASLTATNNQIGAQVAEANARLTAQAQAGAGSFLGTLLGVGTNALGGKGLFSSGGIFGGAGSGGSIATDATLFNTSDTAFLGDVGSYLGAIAL